MKKILIRIKDNELIFKERVKIKEEYKSLINTNVISSDELVFSLDYIMDNLKIVASFIDELCKTYHINRAIIEKKEIAPAITELLKYSKGITSLYLKGEYTLNYSLCENIISSNIKELNCYNLQPFMIELFDKNNIIVESRSEILFLSNFMIKNNLNLYSSLFYKHTLNITFPMTEEDEEDFITFCKINKYLKNIHVNIAELSDLEFIVLHLKETNKKNIKIYIHDNITDLKIIEYLKNYNKKKSKRSKIYFRLLYSNEYISNNIFKQTNSKILKSCVIIILSIIILALSYVFVNNFIAKQNDDKLKEDISKVIDITDTTEIVEKINTENSHQEKKYVVKNKDIAALVTINPETIGWLKVNDTTIDYPVVRHNDNKYYLNKNFNLEDDNNGWVFMDYRNSDKELDYNTIIYAHNRYYSGVMFGPLQNALKSSWYEKEDNQIITFRTLYEDYEFKIFSIYKIYKTNDYMNVKFTTDEVRKDFYDMLKMRSIYDFNVEVLGSDKIITLSTCADNDNRIVVHAVLQKK